MESEGFYVTLPSNASKELFKDNTSGCYTVDLAKPIELTGEWTVGLCEFIYPRTWYNLPPDASYLELMRTTEEEDQPLVILKFGRGGHYGRIKDLLEHLVPAIQKYDPSFEASFNNITKRLDVKGNGSHKIKAFPPLAYMLGLRANEWWTLSKRSTPYPCDMSAGVYNLFLYTDIVQYQPVGDSYSPLLSVVNVKGDYGDVVSIRHNTVHYLRVSKKYIKTIRVEIKTDRDRFVDFVYGKTIVKLHFKPA
ncbi:interleukin 18 [Sarotherodon galilaeus]